MFEEFTLHCYGATYLILTSLYEAFLGKLRNIAATLLCLRYRNGADAASAANNNVCE